MTLLAQSPLMTVQQFMARPDARDYELINGRLVERQSMGARASYIAAQISHAIVGFNKQKPLGWPFDSETVYRCFGAAQTGRRFDVSFIRFGRLPGERLPDADVRIPPDLAVEVVSPNDLAYEVDDKVALYLSAGIPLIWLAYPESRTIVVVRADRSSVRVEHNEAISGENILPGFLAPVGGFFPPLENVETTGDVAR